jgi:hypothetical protein
VSTLLAVLIVVCVVAAALGAVYLSWVAGRHERLAARADSAWAALDAQLVRRAAPARTLAALRDDDALAQDADGALTADGHAREAAENALGRALRAAGYDRGAAPLLPQPQQAALDELRIAASRVQVARQIHNDAVRDLLALRKRPAARAMRLGHGDHAGPGRTYFEIDDTVATDGGRGPVAGKDASSAGNSPSPG